MKDSELIAELGGPARVCELMGIPKAGGIQRVQNWKTRGIPARIKLARPDLFGESGRAVRRGINVGTAVRSVDEQEPRHAA